MTMRKMDGCKNCGDIREVAAHGLCFQCYRRQKRAEDSVSDRQFAVVDRHSPGFRREHAKLLRALTAVMAGLSGLGVQRNDVLAIRRMLDPYVAPIAELLAPAPAPEPDKNRGAVLSEHEMKNTFTVHTWGKADEAQIRDSGTENIVTTGAAEVEPIRSEEM
jgi:hypothetical protein